MTFTLLILKVSLYLLAVVFFAFIAGQERNKQRKIGLWVFCGACYFACVLCGVYESFEFGRIASAEQIKGAP